MRHHTSDKNRAAAGEDAGSPGVGVRHIALFVPDLPAAETYYRTVFGMDLVGREVLQNDGLWYSLPVDKNWQAAQAAGIVPGMSALRSGSFVLALFHGQATSGQVYVIGLEMPVE
jgi:catechol 2,3-dioxygenase-like lactoylglutathione lyase family enzyme